MKFLSMCFIFVMFLFKISATVDLTHYSEYIKVNESFVTSCMSSTGKAPQWQFKGHNLSHYNGFDTFSKNGTTTLFIVKVVESMFGIYTCTDGETKDLLHLHDYDKALSVSGCDAVKVELPCDYIWIPCKVKVSEGLAGRFFWTRNDTLMENSQTLHVSEEGIAIKNVTEENDGLYSLVVLTERDIMLSVNIQVVVVAPPRVFFNAENLAKGRENFLNCTATSTRDLHVQFVGANNLTKSVQLKCSKYYSSGAICNAILTVVPNELESHNITCMTSNMYGNNSASVTVNTLEIPSTPIVRVLDPETVIWHGEYSSDIRANNFVSQFIVKATINSMITMLVLPGNIRSLKLRDLGCDFTTEGTVTIIAVNDGVTSEAANVIVRLNYGMQDKERKSIVAGISTAAVLIILMTVTVIYILCRRKSVEINKA